MTVLPRQKLSIGKKINFIEQQFEGEVISTTTDSIVDDYEIEDGTIDYTALDENNFIQPIVHEPSSTSTSSFNTNATNFQSTENNSSSNAFPNVFNQKKTQEKDYQEMLIVRQALDFDERAFRDSYIRTESEIILKMRKDIDALYDWLDRLVADLTKSLNTFQETKKTSIEEKLRAIRENSVRADAINRSIQNFLTSIQHAYQHSFAPFLERETE